MRGVAARVRESFVTIHALKRFVSCMDSYVLLQTKLGFILLEENTDCFVVIERKFLFIVANSK